MVLRRGLERGEALRGRSFWLIGMTYFTYLMGVGFGVVHFVPYLIGLGMSAQRPRQCSAWHCWPAH